jgi:hypothetical protein
VKPGILSDATTPPIGGGAGRRAKSGLCLLVGRFPVARSAGGNSGYCPNADIASFGESISELKTFGGNHDESNINRLRIPKDTAEI